MFRLKRVSNFSNDQQLITQLFELTRPNYIDNSSVLTREIKHCNEIYLLYNGENELVAFFMINFEKVDEIDTFYLGLSGCRNDYKGFGLAKCLWTEFFIDCKHKEKRVGTKILCWWTTASPIPFKWFNDNIESCEPNTRGDISAFGLNVITKIAALKFKHIYIDSSVPFILRGVAAQTNYSCAERERLDKVCDELQLTAFERFPIDEANGDRYLMIGYAPKLAALKQLLAHSNLAKQNSMIKSSK